MTRCLISALLTAFAMTLVSCTVTTQYVVLTDVPANPSITVIPASMARADVWAANLVMQALVGCHITVVERPVMFKERSDYEGNGSAGGIGTAGGQVTVVAGSGHQKGEVATTVDPTSLIEQTKADYVLIVQAQGGRAWAKLLKRETTHIIFAGFVDMSESVSMGSNVDPDPGAAASRSMRKILTSAGIIR